MEDIVVPVRSLIRIFGRKNILSRTDAGKGKQEDRGKKIPHVSS
jgi:hypothetical protein